MRKNFYLSGLFLCILALCVCGCGGGSAADPMGTGTVQFVDESGSVITSADVGLNGTIPLIAQVLNLGSDGTSAPVVNEKVTFSLVNTGNGASLSVVNDRTDFSGQVMVFYTAGNNEYLDIVRVTTDGSGSTAQIYIYKTGGPSDRRIDTLTADSPVAAGQSSIVTANVTDGNSNPVMGEIVRFSLPVNGSGASFAGAYADGNFYAYTDASGNAVAIYTAGSNSSLTAVYDTVQAELENGSSKAVVITVSGEEPPEPPGPVTPLSIAVKPDPASVSAGQVSIVTATR